jgi:hypothetical protein
MSKHMVDNLNLKRERIMNGDLQDTALYEITLRRTADKRDVHGILRSSKLDEMLHPSRKVGVIIKGIERERDGHRLTTFVARSIAEYVRFQPQIRTAIENAVGEGLAGEKAKAVMLDGKLWKRAKISAVVFEEKNILTNDKLLAWKNVFPKISTVRLRRHSDKKSTQSRFVLQIMADWDREHSQLMVTFRDGVLVDIAK